MQELTELYLPGFNRDGYEEDISNILALTLWDRCKNDPADALYHYKRGCSLAGSRTVPEIYEAFGSRFSFGEDVIEPLAKRLRAVCVRLVMMFIDPDIH